MEHLFGQTGRARQETPKSPHVVMHIRTFTSNSVEGSLHARVSPQDWPSRTAAQPAPGPPITLAPMSDAVPQSAPETREVPRLTAILLAVAALAWTAGMLASARI